MAARKTKATGRPVGAKSKPRTPLITGDTPPPGNRKGGNPPIPFRSDFHCAFALRQCLLGSTDAELADDLGVSPSTLYLWQRRCHGASGLRSHWRLGSQGDEENQLHRAPVSA
jgi:hypothetical protein